MYRYGRYYGNNTNYSGGHRTPGYSSYVSRVATQAAARGAAMALAKVTPKKSAPKKKSTAAKKTHKIPSSHLKTTHEQVAKTHSNSGVGRNIGQFVGSMVPGVAPLASQALGWLGDKLEDGIGSLFGFGEYKVESNSLMDNGTNVIAEGGRPPEVRNEFKHDGSSVVIRHQEPLGDIITSSTPGEFKLQSFAIQPGLATSFPWLAAMAQNFQQYRILGMLFEFRSMAADAISGTNIALGTVTMATNYNSSAPNYANKKDM